MDCIIRKIQQEEVKVLDTFLYEAIFIPEGAETPPKDIINQPELQVYVEDFGNRTGDICFVAEADKSVVGAVWVRIMDDYGHVDNETPSFAISLLKEYRNYGIGTELMKTMLAELKASGYKQASLAVQKQNYAVKMYQKLGFQIMDENEEEYIMVCQLLKKMNILVVYCHPSKNSFTHAVKESFVKGLEDAGYSYEISDLYAENFCPVMSEDEYVREGYYQMDRPVKEDVLREQEKINRTDIIVFIYPDFWTASPAMLEGWFQRVWTYGFAYGNERAMKPLEKAMFLVTMGGSLKDEIRREQLEAMKTVMVGDRIRDRAKKCEVYVFDEMTRGYGNDENREKRAILFSNRAYDLAQNIESTLSTRTPEAKADGI